MGSGSGVPGCSARHSSRRTPSAHGPIGPFAEAADMGIDNLEHGFFPATDFVADKPLDVCPGQARGQQTIAALDIDGAPFKALVKKLVDQHEKLFMKEFRGKPERSFELIADYLKAVRSVMDKIWGANDRYKFTSSVTLKAIIRVFGDFLEREDLIEKWRENPSPRIFEKLVSRWADLKDEFRNEGFYERFPAKGQIERVRVIEQRLLREVPAH